MLAGVKTILGKLEKACGSVSFGSGILKNIYIIELMVYINKAFMEACDDDDADMEIASNKKIDSIIKYINGNLCQELSLGLLSSVFYMGKYHLLREFKKCTGYTIHDYIKRKRLIMARSLLKEGLPVTEACSKCGFGDYSNFIRAFKKAYGASPKKYFKARAK